MNKAGATARETAIPYPPRRTAWYAVGILVLAYTFSFIDRSVLALLIPPIKADLQVSDTAVSLLHGFAFAIFYTTLGVPIARLSDRRSRRTIIVISTLIWSIMTVICGLTQRYWQLFAARVGVGVGEAALSPAAYSMIADLFPKERLGRALSVYSTGVYVGAGLAFLIGGWVVETVSQAGFVDFPLFGRLKPWQATFVLVGLPGIAIAGLLLTVKEPLRHLSAKERAGMPTFREAMARLRQEAAAYGTHFLGFSLIGLVFNGFIGWNTTLFVRAFDYTPGNAGIALGWILLFAGPLGILAGGWTADALGRRGRGDAMLIAGALGGALMLPFAIAAPLMPTDNLALALFAPFYFFASFPYGASAAAIQLITPNRMRAQMSALYLLVLNLLGIGFGPTVIALVNDVAFAGASLSQAMAWVAALVTPLGVLTLIIGRKPFRAAARRLAAA